VGDRDPAGVVHLVGERDAQNRLVVDYVISRRNHAIRVTLSHPVRREALPMDVALIAFDGSMLGTVIGSQEGEPTERDREPTLLADKLRGAI
jgi:hypothetical protein